MKTLFKYSNCECGMFIRLAALKEDSDIAKGLAAHGAHAFAGECPHCKAVVQLTVQPASVIRPAAIITPT